LSARTPTIERVKEYWETDPCGRDTATADDRLRYFLDVESYRYDSAPSIPEIARFASHRGNRVLEIGCGLGTDGAQFALAGADYVGVDLTEAAVALARENFGVRGLQGEFLNADAERLPLASESFDHVYSFGVIHHSPDPSRIVAEIRRVLKPGGTFTVMLYNRTSVNYYVEIMFLRKAGRMLLRPKVSPALLARLLQLPVATLDGHRQKLLRNPHPTHEQWVSMNTDGPDCPLSRVYSATQALELFVGFDDLMTEVRHFDRGHWSVFGRALSDDMSERLGRRVGWLRIVRGRKPAG
jgi:SAM-dependent methyltransferase